MVIVLSSLPAFNGEGFIVFPDPYKTWESCVANSAVVSKASEVNKILNSPGGPVGKALFWCHQLHLECNFWIVPLLSMSSVRCLCGYNCRNEFRILNNILRNACEYVLVEELLSFN